MDWSDSGDMALSSDVLARRETGLPCKRRNHCFQCGCLKVGKLLETRCQFRGRQISEWSLLTIETVMPTTPIFRCFKRNSYPGWEAVIDTLYHILVTGCSKPVAFPLADTYVSHTWRQTKILLRKNLNWTAGCRGWELSLRRTCFWTPSPSHAEIGPFRHRLCLWLHFDC